MNDADVYDAITTTLEALTPAGGRTGSADKFRGVDELSLSSASRSFELLPLNLSEPWLENATGVGLFGSSPAKVGKVRSVFRLGILYPKTERRRALIDAGQVRPSLIALPGSALNSTTYSSQIVRADATPASWVGWANIAEDAQYRHIIAQWDVTVIFDSRDP